MINLELQKEYFKNHVAKLTDYGNIKILDFKNPESSNYRIRFLFEEDYCRCHISGDLGELIATNYYNMTYEKFKDFVNNIGYFKEKIDCSSRSLYEFDEDVARQELLERIKDWKWEEEILDEYDSVEDFIDYALDEYGHENDRGISNDGYEVLEKFDCDAWEWAYNLGKVSTGILDLYMLAFKLAQKQLQEELKHD